MKNIVPFLMILCAMLVSCSKTDEAKNFYSNDYRTGLWVNSTQDDTLQFVDASHMIRKGKYLTIPQSYIYKIEDNRLILGITDFSSFSQHVILKVEGNCLQLDNMYPGPDYSTPETYYKMVAK
ncbi:hypothetical protein [Paludibacter sp.]|uniref:hypothetical protein n=1 Tax=Paludibacter sp. TaxID=1898105 RepID=UPI0013550410|nr:hypothetical protein [Paludibacter sp.]MTK53867.1 hypothetical protein [Paludibacter sp.]